MCVRERRVVWEKSIQLYEKVVLVVSCRRWECGKMRDERATWRRRRRWGDRTYSMLVASWVKAACATIFEPAIAAAVIIGAPGKKLVG